MPRGIMSQKEFLQRMKENYGDMYDFSESVYLGAEKDVTFRCHKHGYVTTKGKHLLAGHLCKMCAWTYKWVPVCGWGINDYDGLVKINGEFIESYRRWCSILERCLCEKRLNKQPTYKECSISSEWKYFTKFKEWFDNPENGYRKGYHIDKDLLSKDNKTYSPETCCFLPAEINSALVKRYRKTKKYPTGVQYIKSKKKYRACIQTKGDGNRVLGFFDTVEEASEAYKIEKEKYLKFLADKYYSQGLITERVYNALYNYKID